MHHRFDPRALVLVTTLGALVTACSASTPSSSEDLDVAPLHATATAGTMCNGKVTSWEQLTAKDCQVVACTDNPNVANGCGPAQGRVQRVGAKAVANPFGFEPCCDAHDDLYGACNGPGFDDAKKNADAKFGACLATTCDTEGPKHGRTWRAACKFFAKVMSTAVTHFGTTAYRAAQGRACTCAAAEQPTLAAVATEGPATGEPPTAMFAPATGASTMTNDACGLSLTDEQIARMSDDEIVRTLDALEACGVASEAEAPAD